MNTETFTNTVKYVVNIIKKTTSIINKEVLKIINTILRNDNKIASIGALIILAMFSNIMKMILVGISISYLIETLI